MSRRLFHLDEETGSKFWSIEIAGADTRICHGKVGKAARTVEKTWPSDDAAREAAGRMIAERTGQGYQDLATTPLERACRLTPWEWPVATWRDLAPLTRPAPRAFDLAALRQLVVEAAADPDYLTAAVPHLSPDHADWLRVRLSGADGETLPALSPADAPPALRAALAAVSPAPPAACRLLTAPDGS